MIDVDAMLVQRCHIIVLGSDAAIDAQEWERVAVAGTIENDRVRLFGAVDEARAIFRQALDVRSHVDVRLENGFRLRIVVVAERHALGHFRYFVGQIHAAGTGSDHQHRLTWNRKKSSANNGHINNDNKTTNGCVLVTIANYLGEHCINPYQLCGNQCLRWA